MTIYEKRISEGGVSVHTKKRNGVETAPKWRGQVKVGTVSEALDEHGVPVMLENGTPKLDVKWKTVTRVFSDIPCIPPRRKGSSYGGVREAEAAFREWRELLVSQAHDEYLKSVERATSTKFAYAKMTTTKYMEMYLEELRLAGREPSTLDRYSYSAKLVTDYFGDTPIGEIDEEALKQFDNHMMRKKLGETSRNKGLKLLKAAHKAHRKAIGTDPFEDFKIVTPKMGDPNPLDEESLDKVRADLATSQATQFMTSVEIALRTGMRVGEICGLKWKSVNLKTGSIYVENAIGRIEGGTKSYEKSPKMNSRRKKDPRRLIQGNPQIVECMKRRLRFMAKEYIATVDEFASLAEAKEEIMEHMYVVGNVDGTYANPTVMGRTWRGYSQNLTGVTGKRPTFHDLRHTFASYGICRMGVDPKTMAEILGHSDSSITMNIYAGLLPEAAKDAMLSMGDIV